MGERPATEARMQEVKHPQSIATKVCRRDAWAYRALLLELATPGVQGGGLARLVGHVSVPLTDESNSV